MKKLLQLTVLCPFICQYGLFIHLAAVSRVWVIYEWPFLSLHALEIRKV